MVPKDISCEGEVKKKYVVTSEGGEAGNTVSTWRNNSKDCAVHNIARFKSNYSKLIHFPISAYV